MKNALSLALLFILFSSNAQEITRQEYIEKYASIAIREMQTYGIPASITMAQGILESNNGNSYLALEANNHFGIKCHDWLGASVTKDDDTRNECFRKYEHALASFEDHSKFLVERERYAFLFDYEKDDYKSWAKGLKKAGYATNPQYPQLLIRIIEENELYKLDHQSANIDTVQVSDENTDTMMVDAKTEKKPSKTIQKKYKQISGDLYQTDNGVSYIIINKDITVEQIAAQFNLHVWELYRYNDVHRSQDFKCQKGQRVFVEAKRRRAAKGTPLHKVQTGEKMIDIAQFYGVKLKALYRINGMSIGTQPKQGASVIVARP